MGKKSTPAAPDYTAAAEKEAASNERLVAGQTQANRPTQNTPWGTSSWSQDANGNWTQNVTLSPEEQSSLESQQRVEAGRSRLAESLLGRSQDEFGQPFDWNSLPDYGTMPEVNNVDSSGAYYDKAGDALQDEFTRRREPQFERDTAALDTKLKAMGFNEGDAGYDTEMQKLRQEQGDERQNMADQATLLSGQEASRRYGMDLTSNQNKFGQQSQIYQYANAMRQQRMAEEMQKRGFSLNEINAILTGQQVQAPQFNGFTNAGVSSGPQYLAAGQSQYQSNLDAYNAKQAAYQGLMQGIGAMNPFKVGG